MWFPDLLDQSAAVRISNFMYDTAHLNSYNFYWSMKGNNKYIACPCTVLMFLWPISALLLQSYSTEIKQKAFEFIYM